MDATVTLPENLLDQAKAQIIALSSRPEGWNGTAERLAPRSHTWISSGEQPFDADAFMLVINIEHDGKTYNIYHAPRTNKYHPDYQEGVSLQI